MNYINGRIGGVMFCFIKQLLLKKYPLLIKHTAFIIKYTAHTFTCIHIVVMLGKRYHGFQSNSEYSS